MRFLSNITIEHAIAHHLDHLAPEKIISRRSLKMSEELNLYLSEHIAAVSRLSSLLPARFFDEPGEVARACRAIISGEGKFPLLSAQIAERLFSVMGTNRSLSPGLLIVVEARNNEDKCKFVALLKMEAQPVFKEDRRSGPGGETYIDLVVDPVALPAPGRHLQKCALIKAEHTPARPEILLIDKQARDAGVAGFFHEQFLQAEYCRDSHFRTKKFVREFVKWANKARQEHRFTPGQLDETVSAAREALRREKLSLPEFIEKTIENRGEQNDCLEAMAQRNVDAQFETESKASERFRKISSVKLDHACQIRMPQHALSDRNFYTAAPDPDDETVTVITLRSRKYQVL
ncbi:MAG: nucleoid-associated protein [Verrucomicrobia bacterium]|nr:nucleoid-associated protein [Verrucomicrobiota bacterium]